ncbi:MAG: hypothetical protein ACLPXB_04130 [Thiobacillaceae bacterium]
MNHAYEGFHTDCQDLRRGIIEYGHDPAFTFVEMAQSSMQWPAVSCAAMDQQPMPDISEAPATLQKRNCRYV